MHYHRHYHAVIHTAIKSETGLNKVIPTNCNSILILILTVPQTKCNIITSD